MYEIFTSIYNLNIRVFDFGSFDKLVPIFCSDLFINFKIEFWPSLVTNSFQTLGSSTLLDTSAQILYKSTSYLLLFAKVHKIDIEINPFGRETQLDLGLTLCGAVVTKSST